MKVLTSIKCICKWCKIIKRNNNLYVYCKINPRHKQRQG